MTAKDGCGPRVNNLGSVTMIRQSITLTTPSDVRLVKYNSKYAFKFSMGDPLAVAGDKMWVASDTALLAFDADGGKLKNRPSRRSVNQSMKDIKPRRMLYDGHYLWLLKKR